MGLKEEIARILATAESTDPPAPERVLQQAPAQPPPPSTDAPPWAVALGERLARVEATAGDPFRGLAPAPQRAPITGMVPAASGAAPHDLRDPYALTEDDVTQMIRRDGWTATGNKIMTAIRSAPKRRLSLRRR